MGFKLIALLSILLIATLVAIVDSSDSDTLSTPIKFAGETFTVEFPLEKGGALFMAKKFCDDKALKAGISEASVNEMCTRPIGELLVGLVEKELTRRQRLASTTEVSDTIQVLLDIGGEQYTIDFNTKTETAVTAATGFCSSHKSKFGLVDSNMHSCVDPVRQRLEEAVVDNNSKLASESAVIESKPEPAAEKLLKSNPNPTVVVEVEVAGTKVSVPHKLGKETTSGTAKQFCVKNRDKLGVRFSELKSKCIEVVQSAIEATISGPSEL